MSFVLLKLTLKIKNNKARKGATNSLLRRISLKAQSHNMLYTSLSKCSAMTNKHLRSTEHGTIYFTKDILHQAVVVV